VEAWLLLLSLKKGTMKEKPQTVRVELPGGFRVSVGSRTVGEDGWRPKKAKSATKLLSLSPAHRMHREEVMMDLLWSVSSDHRSQSNSLRQALHAAQRALAVEHDPAAASPSSNSYPRFLEDQVALCPEGALWVEVAHELSNRRIAEDLSISERTVATRVHEILKKLNLRSRVQIAAWAMEQELLR
jgi:DNA-binding CsgD family transcriptional regulator